MLAEEDAELIKEDAHDEKREEKSMNAPRAQTGQKTDV